MRTRPHRASLTLLLIGALVGLLALLALLQYKWLGQISTAERQTMQTNLRTQARALQEETNKEIELAVSRLRISISSFRANRFDELIERYAKWKRNAAYPDLIENVYVAHVDGDGQFNLMQLVESANRLEPIAWPTSFADIRRRFAPPRQAYAYAHERREMERRDENRSIGSLIEHGYVAEEIPALVRFLVELERVREPENQAERELLKQAITDASEQSPIAIIVLDMDYLRQVLLPALFKRRFTVDGSLDYDLAVIYRKAPDERDEKAGLKPEASSPAGDLAINMFQGMSSAEINRGSRWQVIINHRAGSLDAAVAQARGRNLVVSFGILSLLAVSMIIIIVISRRAQRLARKQIDFVAGVSHEFRTPLAVIHAVSENLADGLITDKPQIEQCGVVIRNDVRRLAGMVEQVLEFAGASRGKSLYQPQPVEVRELIDKALAGNPSLEAHQDWQIEREIEPNLPPVLADRAALTSAVRNIIDNAIKYRGDHHWIGIKAEARIGNRQTNGATSRGTNNVSRVEITIADRGIGIPESDLPHIFEAFYRGQAVVAAQIHGNGLGLSLVKNIIEAHGGTIGVASTPGEGTSFTLSLPAANVTAGTPAAAD